MNQSCLSYSWYFLEEWDADLPDFPDREHDDNLHPVFILYGERLLMLFPDKWVPGLPEVARYGSGAGLAAHGHMFRRREIDGQRRWWRLIGGVWWATA